MKKIVWFDRFFKAIMLISVIVILISIFTLVNETSEITKVISFTGKLQASVQRLVKKEILFKPDDELIAYADNVDHTLRTGGGEFSLVRLSDAAYQSDLKRMNEQWITLKSAIRKYRTDKTTIKQLVEESEKHFTLAGYAASSVLAYSNRQTKKLKDHEYLLLVMVLTLVAYTIIRLAYDIRISEKIKSEAYNDNLTMLATRKVCDMELARIEKLKHRNPIGIIVFDLNNLKTINDEYGHDAGDVLLNQFASNLRAFKRDNVFIGRNGGDEFLMIVENMPEESVKRLLKDIKTYVHTQNTKNDCKYPITYAYGYAYGTESVYDMLHEADKNMYDNKRETKRKLKNDAL